MLLDMLLDNQKYTNMSNFGLGLFNIEQFGKNWDYGFPCVYLPAGARLSRLAACLLSPLCGRASS
jgi:hypothetical protein